MIKNIIIFFFFTYIVSINSFFLPFLTSYIILQ